MRFSTFKYAADNVPVMRDLSWPEFVEEFKNADVRTSKDGPCWSPATYDALGQTRSNKSVKDLQFLVFDLDTISESEHNSLRGRLLNLKLNYIIHSTFSHDPPNSPALRLILPLQSTISPGSLGALRVQVVHLLELRGIDTSTLDPARIYYTPTSQPSTAYTFECGYEAAHLDPVSVNFQATQSQQQNILPVVEPPAATNHLTVEFWRARLRTLSNPNSQVIADRILAGAPLAEDGQRDATMFRAASILSYACSGASDQTLEDLITPSLRAMDSDLGLEVELGKFREKLARAREQYESNRDEAAKAAGLDGDKYTEEQVEKWTKEYGHKSVADFMKHILIQKDDAFYVLVDGRYKIPIRKSELDISLPRDLKRYNIQWQKYDGKKLRHRSTSEILADHCTVARSISGSLVLDRSYYDGQSQVFWEAVAPIRSFTPTRHVVVENWLALLGGKQVNKLLDWLASVTNLTKPCAALFLEGEPGTGKGLLANGLSRLWRNAGPTPFASVIGDFNQAVAECPLVVADEGFPAGKHFNVNDELRRLTGDLNITVRRKYLPEANINGSIRLLITANNDQILSGLREMSPSDRDALAQRLLYIYVDAKPRQYLDALPYTQKEAIVSHMLAEHVLWLRENRNVLPGPRFVVEGSLSQLHNRLSISAGATGDVVGYLVKYIDRSTAAMRSQIEDRLLIGNGLVGVRPLLFESAKWKELNFDAPMPPPSKLYTTLQNICDPTLQLKNDMGSGSMSFVQPDLLKTWIHVNKDGNWSRIKAMMDQPNAKLETESRNERPE